ncbi:MAG: hypothetical protein OEL83_15445 [Desulforhopalus sp.]|nr:hypothetical protein [Desulforhopalus sp.]
MKAILFRAIFSLLAMVLLVVAPIQAKQTHTPKHQAHNQGNVPSTTLDQQLIVVEDLAAEVHTDSGTITVTAKIRNVSRAMIRGFATIHLLSGEGNRVLSYEEEINGGEAFAHGSTVEFEVTAKVGDIKKISSITVDFTKT